MGREDWLNNILQRYRPYSRPFFRSPSRTQRAPLNLGKSRKVQFKNIGRNSDLRSYVSGIRGIQLRKCHAETEGKRVAKYLEERREDAIPRGRSLRGGRNNKEIVLGPKRSR